MSQTYGNLEIILVDDGSPDGCSALCDAWNAKDSRIGVIHQTNAGLSQARNAGLAMANGMFVGFVDSDDWIEPRMYESLLRVQQETEAEIGMCDYREEPDGDTVAASVNGTNERKQFTPEEAIKNTFLNTRGFVVVWNKLYRKSILNGILFPVGRIYEDVFWTHRIMAKATKIVYLDNIFYHYLQRTGTLSRNSHFFTTDSVEACKERIEFSHQYFPSLEIVALHEYLHTCCNHFMALSTTQQHFDLDGMLRHNLHQRFCKEQWWKVLWDCPLKTKIRFLLFRFCPGLLVRITTMYMAWSHLLKMLDAITAVP